MKTARIVLLRSLLARSIGVALILALVVLAKERPTHPDYVPNEKVAERIGEAVLIGQFGEDRVKAQLPLNVLAQGKDKWIMQGRVLDSEGHIQVGGGFGILLDKHNGCVLELVENMK